MREHPTLFSGSMVRSILADTKTQTRRIAKQTAGGHLKEPRGNRRWHPADPDAVLACPYGQPGDRLWVRETWGWNPDYPPGVLGQVQYRADPGHYAGKMKLDNVQWKPSIHMPRQACRILLDVTAVRVERLNAISEADAYAEGIEQTEFIEDAERQEPVTGSPAGRYAFRALWEDTYGPDAWAANPWVWVVEFKRVTGEGV